MVVARVADQGFEVRLARGSEAIAARNLTLGTVGYLPRLDGTLAYRGTEASQAAPGNFGGLDGNTPSLALTSYNTATAGVGLSWTALDFGRGPAYRRLESERDQAAAYTETTLTDALGGALTAYYDVVRQQQLVSAIEETVALSEERLRLATVQLRAGTVNELDAGLARVDLNADRATLLREAATLTTLKTDLRRRMGETDTLDFAVVDTITIVPGLARRAALDAARANNPQLDAARQAQQGAALGVREVRRARLPTLFLDAGYQFSGIAEGVEPDLFNRDDSFTYGATLTVPLFDGFTRRRHIATATIQARNAATTVEQVQARIHAAVVVAHARYQNGLDQIVLEAENVAVARRNVEIAYAQQRAGTITAVDLRQVQVSLLNAQTRLLDAQFSAKQAELELRRLGGSLLTTAPGLPPAARPDAPRP